MNYNSELTKNDFSWNVIFDKYNILKEISINGYYEISSMRINEFREARLMTKFDHKINLPKIFLENNLSILPISRGSYVISNFETYKDIDTKNNEITKVSFPDNVMSIDYENIYSEAVALNCAYITGILSDFIEEFDLLPTISGRMSSNNFTFYINNNKINKSMSVNVENAQIEIDAGYEGKNNLLLVEAKNVISDDFLIRQIYYPFRLWSSKVPKKIRNVFMIYSNGIFNLYEYGFRDINHYNSLELIKQKKYSIEPTDLILEEIIYVLENTVIIKEPLIAFPQADNFSRIINLCELLLDEEKSKEEITLNYAFTDRQTNYYTDAGRYLGVIEKKMVNEKTIFYLTDEAKKILKLRFKDRQLFFARLILSHQVFNETLRVYLRTGEVPQKSVIVDIMMKSQLYNIESPNTYERRSFTIISWINWILDLQR